MRSDKKQTYNQESFRASRFVYTDKQNGKNQQLDVLNSKLLQNLNTISEALVERKLLLLTKIDKMQQDKRNREEVINRGKLQDLKNEARLLRDENIIKLIEGSDRVNSTKVLLRRIMEQHNLAQLDTMQKAKGKRFFEKAKEIDENLNQRTRRYAMLQEELNKINEKQRNIFRAIEAKELEIISLLKNNQVKRAEEANEEIERNKAILKEHKISRDRKKTEIKNNLADMLEALDSFDRLTCERSSEIEELQGGVDNLADFDQFILYFQRILETRNDVRKNENRDKTIDELRRVANEYEALANALVNGQGQQQSLFERINEYYRSDLKISLIEKAYLQDISSDKGKLIEVLKRCRTYRTILDAFEEDKLNLLKYYKRIEQMKAYHQPLLEALQDEELRKEELKKRLLKMNSEQAELERVEKNQKEFDIITSNYMFQKQILEREVEEAAQKGNVAEYKKRTEDLDRLSKDFQRHHDLLASNEYGKMQKRLTSAAQEINLTFADLIRELLQGEKDEMSHGTFLKKLSKRLSLT